MTSEECASRETLRILARRIQHSSYTPPSSTQTRGSTWSSSADRFAASTSVPSYRASSFPPTPRAARARLAQIEELQRPEWADGYVDYAGLKKTLNAMIKSGHTQVFDENMVYAPISVATSEETIQPNAPHEVDFMTQVDGEIEKVNRFKERLHSELNDKVAAVQAVHGRWLARGSAAVEVEALKAEVEACSTQLQLFEDYINLNYVAFSKILKKHDKVSTCPFRMPYLMKIQKQTFMETKMLHIIKGISDMHASLHGNTVKAGAETFDPNQKGGSSFIRKTSKYWVMTKDVLRVKMFLLKHLPIYKFTDGRNDGDLVSSVYFDNPQRELYAGRLKKFDQAHLPYMAGAVGVGRLAGWWVWDMAGGGGGWGTRREGVVGGAHGGTRRWGLWRRSCMLGVASE